MSSGVLCFEETMSASGPSLAKTLLGKLVIVKLPGWSRGLPATVLAVEDSGFWFASKEIMVALKETNGVAVSRITAPSLYVPLAYIEWIVASVPQETSGQA
jgi:hypothetical protein